MARRHTESQNYNIYLQRAQKAELSVFSFSVRDVFWVCKLKVKAAKASDYNTKKAGLIELVKEMIKAV